MNSSSGPLSFDALISDVNFTSWLTSSERRVMGFSDTVIKQADLVDKSLSKIGKSPTGLSTVSREADTAGLSLQRLGVIAVGAFAFNQLRDLPMQLLRVRGEFQQLEISLTTFLKSKERADTLLGEIVKAASETPFSFRDIASGAKQLLAYGSSANTVVQELRMLGDVAAGVSAPINDIIYLYGTLRTQGRAYTKDIQQFASRGIGIYEELAKVLKMNVSQVNDFVTAGKVGFREVEIAFKNMTSGAGIFAGLTEAQSKSLTGLKERLSDAYDVMLNDIGKKNQEILQDSIQTATYVVEHYSDIIDILEVLAGAYGGYKTAVLLTSVVEKERATIAAFVAASVDKQAAAQIASAAASLPAMRAQVSALAAQKAEVVALATAKSAALKVAQQELITAQAAVAANANILDAAKRNASIRAAEIAENNVIAAQEAATLTRKQAITVSSEFYATKAALGTVVVTAQATAETRLTAAQAFRASVTQRLTALQTALNASMFANPIVLAVTAIAALTAAYYAFREEVIEIKSAQDLLKESTSEANSKFSAQKAEITSLVNVVKNQNVAESQRILAYQKLKEIAPGIIRDLDFQAAKTADLTKQTNIYLESLEKRIRLESITGRYKEAFDQDSKITAEVDAATKDYLRKKKTAEVLAKNPSQGGGTFGVVNNASQQAAKEASDALEKLNRLSSQSIESRKVIKEIGTEIEGVYKGRSKDAIQAHITQLEIAARAITDKLSPAYKLNEESLNSWKKQLSDLNSVQATSITFANQLATAETASALRIAKGLATTDNQLDELQKKVKERAGDATRGGKEKADLEQLSREIDRLQGKKTKSEKDAEKVGPYGTLSYWENVIKKIEEANSKTDIKNKPAIAKNQATLENAKQKAEEIRAILEAPADSLQQYERQLASAQKKLEFIPKTDTAEIEKQKQIIVDAQNEIENIRKVIAVKSFEDEISEKKSLYELYYKWVGEYGKATADKQFDSLLASGQSYVDFLNSEIAKLETQRDKGKLNEKDTKNLGTLLAQRDEATGKKSPLDVFNESLEKAQKESSNLADYLVKLKQKQDDLGKSTNSPTDVAIRRRLAEEVVKTQADLQSRLREFLTSYASSGEQQLAIQKDFAEKRAALDQKYNGQKGDDYKASLKIIDDAEKQALQDYQQRKLEEGEAYKETTKVILAVGEKRAAIEIQRQRAVVADAKNQFGVNSEAYKRALEALNALIDKNGGTPAQKILGTYSQVFGQIGQGLSQLGGEAGKAGDILTGLAGNFDLVSQAMDKNLDKGKRMAIAIQGAIGLITSIAEASQQRKKADEDYYNSVIAQQQQYNLLLNEQIGIRSNEDGIFGTDYVKKLKGDFAQMYDAQSKYQESLKKLNQGKAQAGLKNTFDSGTFLKSVGSGAAAGASFVPVVGGLIGGIVGGIVGLFTSNKKVAEFGDLLSLYPKLIQKSADGVDELNVNLAQSLIDQGLLDDKTKALVQSTIDWQKQVEKTKEALKEVVKSLVGTLGDNLGNSLVQAFKDGTDAAMAFKGTLEDILEDFVTKLLYSKVLAPYLDQLGNDITQSLSATGDQSITDDLQKFYKNAPKILQQTTDYLQTNKDLAKAAGLDIFKSTKDTSKNPNSIGQAIQATVTENTANILAGQLNAMRITQADTNAQMRNSILLLSGIRDNTARIQQTNELLDEMRRDIKIIASDPTRGLGGLPR